MKTLTLIISLIPVSFCFSLHLEEDVEQACQQSSTIVHIELTQAPQATWTEKGKAISYWKGSVIECLHGTCKNGREITFTSKGGVPLKAPPEEALMNNRALAPCGDKRENLCGQIVGNSGTDELLKIFQGVHGTKRAILFLRNGTRDGKIETSSHVVPEIIANGNRKFETTLTVHDPTTRAEMSLTSQSTSRVSEAPHLHGPTCQHEKIRVDPDEFKNALRHIIKKQK